MTSRETIARLCNVIRALAAYGVQLFDTIILTAYDISMKYKVKELLNAEVMEHVAQESYEHSLHQTLWATILSFFCSKMVECEVFF